MNESRWRRAGSSSRAAIAGVTLLACAAAGAAAQEQQVKVPQPTVPEVFTLMGQFVRVAYNNEGFATMGYRIAQQSIGEEWLLLEVGLTVRGNTKNYTLKREHLSVKTPDGTVIPLASQGEYQAANPRALNMRLKVQHDSINYFPVDAHRACAIQFFAELGSPGPRLAFDQVELSTDRGCVGRLYFKVPGGIKVGQHWLNVKFAESEVQVPFRILTKEEEKEFSKSWQDIKKSHEATYKQ